MAQSGAPALRLELLLGGAAYHKITVSVLMPQTRRRRVSQPGYLGEGYGDASGAVLSLDGGCI